VKGQKVRLTYAFTSNADGSEKLPPIIIGKAKRPQVFQKKSGKQLGFYYQNNAKPWMTLILYQEWIQEWDSELQVKTARSFFYKIISLVTLFQMVFRTSMSRILSQISLHMSSQ
jgi:DDE superfamily endonuclease